ncbi:alpha/beta fold hydrolase [Camelimonas abortus]|uniref:Alpha/beta fold hydrolase n=1 Tax=Camelimonas abortus TaxID=1017184 RepID=A0ABV7LBG4_9HYPH
MIRNFGRTTLESPSARPGSAAPQDGARQTPAHPPEWNSPLAPFAGARPPAPAWFEAAIAAAPQRGFIDVRGAAIELLVWGERGRPGLMFLHGNGAHADWWSFIAPFFARDHRVAAISWSGMGNSGHRPHYSLDIFVEEILAGAEAAGLFDNGLPVVVGHSFGGMPLVACAARHGERLKAAVAVDSPLMSPERRRARRARRGPPKEPKPHRVYPTLQEALGRFRFQPPQPCENLYIADFIARGSLKEVPGGFTWKFDPFLWKDYHGGKPHIDLAGARCPLALVFAERSVFLEEDVVNFARETAPPGSPLVMIPEAWHHIMVDQPLAFVSALRGLLAGWPEAR